MLKKTHNDMHNMLIHPFIGHINAHKIIIFKITHTHTHTHIKA